MARPLVRDDEGLSTFWSFVGVLVLVIAILAVYFVYVIPKFGHPPLRAQSGDQVKVDYVGRFEDGFVFDTSLASVAEDNASYTKAFSFGWRNSWQPLGFAIGAVPLAVIQGFDVGVQGLAVGDAKTIVVPPNLGYGLSDPTKILMKPLFEPVPVRVTMNESAFTNTYKTQPVSGANVTDPFWGWSAYVSVSGSIVTVTNSPVPGQMVHPYGSWAARVDSVDDGADNGTGRIVVHHLLDTTAVDRVGQKTASGPVVFVVTAVDLAAGPWPGTSSGPPTAAPSSDASWPAAAGFISRTTRVRGNGPRNSAYQTGVPSSCAASRRWSRPSAPASRPGGRTTGGLWAS